MLLNCHTRFSYKYGTVSVDQLIAGAIASGYQALALTDINSTSACIELIRQCKEQSLRPVVGIDFRNGVQQQYIGIAKNNEGFQELNEHLTWHLHHEQDFETAAPAFHHAFVVYPFGKRQYHELRDNEFVGVQASQLSKVVFSEWRNHHDKLVILHPVSFHNKRDFNAHRLLRAIDNNVLLSMLPKSEEGRPDEVMIPHDELRKLFDDFPIIVRNTEKLIDECQIDFVFKEPKNKQTFTGSRDGDYELMRRACSDGLKYRFGNNPSKIVTDRMEHELRIIRQLDFCSYFLINYDLVNFVRSQGRYYIGRGSGANSLVAYLMRITDVDPIELDLYFERFINPARNSPPDFDLDFSSRDRDAITKYIFDRHGWDKTALVGTYITFQYRSVIRELGKVFGLPSAEIDKLQHTNDVNETDDMGKLVLKYSSFIHDFPSHLSVHSSGILISELPISAYSATIMPPKGFPTVFFSMLEAEDIGFSKFDILGQRGLSKIEDTVQIVKDNRGEHVDIHDLARFKKDEKVKDLLREGKAIGCFYVESPAMRMLLKKLSADDYIRLVAASSIIRPGVAKSGMMREYILRYREPHRRQAARDELPALYDLLAETYGVMVYQEDVIKVAHLFAGLTLAESDILRRGMSWKFKQRNEFGKVKNKFFDNCAEKGYPKDIVQRVWEQIESFANYAFSKGHSASYAVESFQALFLKAYYPIEYMVATINCGGGFYSRELYIHEARMHGAIIENPCINRSDNICVVEGNVVYLGLGFVRDLEDNVVRKILANREYYGSYHDLQDFISRVPISLEQLCTLIRADAFRYTGRQKKQLLWDAHFILSKTKKSSPVLRLFEPRVKEFVLPQLYTNIYEAAYDEIELFGFSVTMSPFQLVASMPDGKLMARHLPMLVDKYVEIIGYFIHAKRTATSGGKKMYFGTFIDREGYWIDTVNFPPVAAKYPFRGPGCYLIRGKVVEEFTHICIETSELYRLPSVNLEEPSTRLKMAAPVG